MTDRLMPKEEELLLIIDKQKLQIKELQERLAAERDDDGMTLAETDPYLDGFLFGVEEAQAEGHGEVTTAIVMLLTRDIMLKIRRWERTQPGVGFSPIVRGTIQALSLVVYQLIHQGRKINDTKAARETAKGVAGELGFWLRGDVEYLMGIRKEPPGSVRQKAPPTKH